MGRKGRSKRFLGALWCMPSVCCQHSNRLAQDEGRLHTTVNFVAHSPQVMNWPTAFKGPGLTFCFDAGPAELVADGSGAPSSRSSESTEAPRLARPRRLETGSSRATESTSYRVLAKYRPRVER